VKCIYIDPPYNTRSAFEHYDDNLEHSVWLSMMYPRLELLRELLAEDGSIWVSIDDNEAHYLKVVMDEMFGRKNFVANVLWQKRTSPNARIHHGGAHDRIMVFAKSVERSNFNKLNISFEQAKTLKIQTVTLLVLGLPLILLLKVGDLIKCIRCNHRTDWSMSLHQVAVGNH